MSIDINGVTQSQVHTNGDDTQVKRPSEPTVATVSSEDADRTSTADTVSLSDSAVRLGEIGNSVASLPVVNTQRVEQVKQAINEGNYQVDPMKVAEKFMQFESMLKPSE